MIIHRYNPEKPKKASVFYIQSHGLHAGRPLKEPIPNSWEIETDIKNAFEICFMVYNSKTLKLYLRGSVIPFLSLEEYKKILKPLFDSPLLQEETTLKKLKSLQLLDVAIKKQEETRQYYNQLKTAIAHDLLTNFHSKSH